MQKQTIIKEESVKKIVNNVRIAKGISDRTRLDANYNSDFNKYFHLRPTSSGVTVVSILPYAPMRGVVCTIDNLDNLLEKLHKGIKRLTGRSTADAEKFLESVGFKKRDKEGAALEEHTQASFIRGMILGQSNYEGVEFVASELALCREKRFDIVGIKGETLYIFELKKGRTFSAISQANEYAELVKDNKTFFDAVLETYPNRPVPRFSKVKVIIVMEYSANATPKLRADTKAAGIEIWYYEPALHFYKE